MMKNVMYLPEIYRETSHTSHYHKTHGLFDNKCWTPYRVAWMLERDGYLKVVRKGEKYDHLVWLSKEAFNSKFVEKYLEGKNFKDYQELVVEPGKLLGVITVVFQFVMFVGIAYGLYHWGFRF